MQEEGRIMARTLGEKYKLFCALYWAEGFKDRTIVGMSNTDMELLKIFVEGLKKYFDCERDNLKMRIMAHLNNGLSDGEISSYWLQGLELTDQSYKGFTLKSKYYKTQNKKKRKHIYGCATVRICSVDIVQKIYGSIQEIFDFENNEWIDI